MSTRPSAVAFPDRPTLLAGVRQVLSGYRGTQVTLRQLYYRLVAAGIIPNNFRSYKNVGAATTKWRRDGSIPLNAFEDRTRGMSTHDAGQRDDDPEGWMSGYIRAGLREARNYQLATWYGQPKRVMVAVEKQALEGPFEQVCQELAVDLAVCRGYPSLSFLQECANSLRRSAKRENVLLYFGDFDPSGLDIPRAVESDLSGFFGQSFEFHRVALTREQADEMDLIPAPAKTTDVRYAGFSAKHGEEVFELDAIDPAGLQQIIRDSILEHFDSDIAEERDATQEAGRQRIEKLLAKSGIEKFLEDLDKNAGGDEPGEEGEDDE